ncbi:MAG: MBOAT family O-acyltransferase, partial [Bacteroidales bacterium]|nr:MBOAT family O-acyltransferase [Bacteroidales bacterium]
MQFWSFFALVFALFSLIVILFQRKDGQGRLRPRHLMRNTYLLLVSLLFYYKTSGWFVGLLILVTCTDFIIGKGIYHYRMKNLREGRTSILPKLLLALSVTIDLGILCYFKYSYFFADMVNQLLGTNFEVTNIAAQAGNALAGRPIWSIERIILPVGISFYTFQVISYTADIYKGLIRPVRNILDFGFYVSFFPQLVAGPIVKASDFIPQLYKPYHLSRMQFGMAVFWVLNGLAKKIILSDYLAVNFIDRVFANPLFFSGFENLSALFVYSLQVYADFSGYTDIAIGLSLMMGFHLPQNFNSPYKAPNCQNFWKRWHISLSRWLQTYLYIPLGGNRNITLGTCFWVVVITLAALILSGSWTVSGIVLALFIFIIIYAWRRPDKRKLVYANTNSMITMLLGGLWHGASVNFMIWGGLNGLGMIIYKVWKETRLPLRIGIIAFNALLLIALICMAPSPLWNVLLVILILVPLLTWCKPGSILLTFIFITFTRLFFRSGSNLDPAVANETAWNIATQMISQIGSSWSVNPLEVIVAYKSVFILFAMGMLIHWLPARLKRSYRILFAKMPLPGMLFVCFIAIFIIYQFVTAEMQPFIYFQF